MKSFEQLAKAAYDAWHKSHGTERHKAPYESLDSTFKAHWVTVAMAIVEEMSSVH
jgi:hypothetical protein